METVDRNVYFEDVRLQMEAKLWGEEYNRHRPPKQVRESRKKISESSMVAQYNPRYLSCS